MPKPISLWGVVTPEGEPVVGSLYHTQYGAMYRYCAYRNIEPEQRPAFWREQKAKGYRVQPFTLHQEQDHG